MGLVLGQGVYSLGKYCAKKDKVWSKEYIVWGSMLTRCYSEKYQKRKPTYAGCAVSDNFKNFQFFAEWCNSQVGFSKQGWQLDKDILLRGNKIYSEDTCVFVPRAINMLLHTKSKDRGLPLGVCYHKRDKSYSATLSESSFKFLGYYDCPLEAHAAYKNAKEVYVREVADFWRGLIDSRVYEALITWKI